MSLIERAKNKVTRTLVDSLFLLGQEAMLYKKKLGASILMYHGVDKSESKKFNLRHVGVENFKKQILWLKTHCHILSIEDYFDGKFNPNKFNVAITFDDGYENNYKYAFPILEEAQIPATFYVTGLNNTEHKIIWGDANNFLQKLYPKDRLSIDGVEFTKQGDDFINTEKNKSLSDCCRNSSYSFKEKLNSVLFSAIDLNDPQLLDYWKLMTDQQIKEVSKSNFVSIGSHGWFHNNLGNIELNDTIKEIELSKNYLESLCQKQIKSIAYPDGSYSIDVKNAAHNLGFKNQLAVYYKHDEDTQDTGIEKRYGIYPAYSWCNQIDKMFE